MVAKNKRTVLFAVSGRRSTRDSRVISLALLLIMALLCLASRPSLAIDYVAKPIGPGIAGQIHAITYDPEDSNTIYVGGDVGGVFRTTDNGAHWESWNYGLSDSSQAKPYYVDDLLVVGNTVWAATHAGIYSHPRGPGTWELRTPRDTFSYKGTSDDSILGRPIPFSCLAYDDSTRTLYAGAGHATLTDSWQYYPEAPGYAAIMSNPYDDQYSLWSCDLSTSATWQPVELSENHGRVRQIAIGHAGESTTYVVYATNVGVYSCRVEGLDYDIACISELANDNSPPQSRNTGPAMHGEWPLAPVINCIFLSRGQLRFRTRSTRGCGDSR